MYAIAPPDHRLSALMSAEDRAALRAIRAAEGDDAGLPSDAGCPGSDDDIPLSRIDCIVSVAGRAVRIHLDPNAPGSVQATGEARQSTFA